MGLLCLEYKAVTVPYFMDNLTHWELQLLLKQLHLCTKQNWLSAREIMLSNLQPYSKKSLKPTDILTFSWEQDPKTLAKQKESDRMTKKDLERMKMNADRMIQIVQERNKIQK